MLSYKTLLSKYVQVSSFKCCLFVICVIYECFNYNYCFINLTSTYTGAASIYDMHVCYT